MRQRPRTLRQPAVTSPAPLDARTLSPAWVRSGVGPLPSLRAKSSHYRLPAGARGARPPAPATSPTSRRAANPPPKPGVASALGSRNDEMRQRHVSLAAGVPTGRSPRASLTGAEGHLHLRDLSPAPKRSSWTLPLKAGSAVAALELNRLTARISPDGRYLAFMSQRSLTGYDNRDAAAASPTRRSTSTTPIRAPKACTASPATPPAHGPTGSSTQRGAFRRPDQRGPLPGRNRGSPPTIPGWTGYRALQAPSTSPATSPTPAASSSTPPTPSSPRTPTATRTSTSTSRPGPRRPSSDTCTTAGPTYAPSPAAAST